MAIKNTTLYLAEYESRHYTWRAVGNSDQEARDLMAETLSIGGGNWTDEEIENIVRDDINVTELRAGMGTRDYTEVL
jgi:hypothetical protein